MSIDVFSALRNLVDFSNNDAGPISRTKLIHFGLLPIQDDYEAELEICERAMPSHRPFMPVLLLLLPLKQILLIHGRKPNVKGTLATGDSYSYA